MTFLNYTSGTKGFKFMRKPNNVIFHAVMAMFDEHMFPSCPDNISPGSMHIGANHPNELNPLEDGWVDGGDSTPQGPYRGGQPPNVGPQVPPQAPNQGPPVPPQGPPAAPRQPFQPPWQSRDPEYPWYWSDLAKDERRLWLKQMLSDPVRRARELHVNLGVPLPDYPPPPPTMTIDG